ncbi:MAG: DNA-binding protein [Lyngbya sp. HA4199-MV5]|jgi:predicted DNA-binding protein with PD1-like motif|nr:DNA-binding protein [Lyngbya sp. HA4199-MV5]
MNIFALRLKPGQDLKQGLAAFVAAKQIRAGFILSAIGSLRTAAIRFANQPTSEILHEKFEIVALNGTLSIHGIHLHLAIADKTGRMLGGHLTEGCIIYTTAEIVIGESPNLAFVRTPDAQTGFLELDIRER